MNRLLLSLAAAGLIFAAGSCAEPGAQDCGNGLVCPEGSRCAAADTVCITDQCGDLEMDPGEICDDGNKDDGDGCAADCLSDETCGNDVIDDAPEMIDPEVCDDDNTEDGDGCSADCLSTEECGNGTLDTEIATPEVCDDDNQTPGDDCNATCSSTNECGNGITDEEVNEICDDMGAPGGCTDDCTGGVGCHDSVIDPGEECDDGNATNTDACVDYDSNFDGDVTDPQDLCRAARCGDGHTRDDGSIFDEECDTQGDSQTCNADCTTAECGDGKVNAEHTPPDPGDTNPFDAPEECDNGTPGLDTAVCTRFCTVSTCGDGYFNDNDPTEECDTAGNSDDCNADCSVAACGDGFFNPANDRDAVTAGLQPEECDTDTASATCDADCTVPVCGDNVFNSAANEDCDPGAIGVNVAGCNLDCTVPSCGDGIWNPSFDPPLPSIVAAEQCDDGNSVVGDGCDNCRLELCGDGTVDADHGEACDDGDTVDTDECRNNCELPRCGDGIESISETCDDDGNTDGCDLDCSLAICGDGFLNTAHDRDPGTVGVQPEQCDDGNGTAGDGCTGCKLDNCGDGVTDTADGEECDDGNTVNTDACTNNCQTAECGDGIDSATEPCDPGPATHTAACDHDCSLAFCGDGILNPLVDRDTGTAGLQPELCDDGNAVAGDGCTQCKHDNCGDGVTDAADGEECDDGNTVDTDTCTNNCQTAECGDGIDSATEACDPGPSTHTATCDFDCTAATCPDGIVNPLVDRDPGTPGLQPEQCDDGNAVAGDGCTACKLDNCGDGVTDAADGEECDDADTDNLDACTNNCQTAECGDGIDSTTEACDPGPSTHTATCNYDCTLASCGDGIWNPLVDRDTGTAGLQPEQCDDGNGTAGDGCTGCKLDNCGDGVTDTADGEECDDGNTVNTDACTNNCQTAECGDGIDSATEPCDPGPATHTATCDFDCTAATCPDGIVNPLVDRDPGTAGLQPEQCDDGNAVAGDGCTGCKLDNCGDGVTDADGEECDDGNTVNTDACTNNCQTAECGDGIDSATEACDPGPSTHTATCNYDCTVASCGDGIWNPLVDRDTGTAGLQPEMCDDGNLTSGDGCSLCALDNCGDGVTVAADGEECDDGNLVDTDACTNNCQTAECGDGIDSATEACDPGPSTQTATCDHNCTVAACPDGVVNPLFDRDAVAAGLQPEMCDDGNAVAGDGCTACKLDTCGDGIEDAGDGEECDDGDLDDTDLCTNSCQDAACGDGIDSTTEACDIGGGQDATCDYDCTLPTCNDGVVNFAAGEQCDDGNAVVGDGCNQCLLEVCGNGLVEAPEGEVCDDDNTLACGLCNATCAAAVTPTAATGSITVVAANMVVDGQIITINDGYGHNVVFEFDPDDDGVASGNVDVDINTGADEAGVRVALQAAIDATALEITTSSPVNNQIALTNDHTSARGNQPITTDTLFTVSGMSGGLTQDCLAGTECTANGDCASNVCTGGVCQ